MLCKPNFEVPRKYLKDGVLKDRNLIFLAVKKVILQVSDLFSVKGICPSFPPGTSGNMEIFILFSRNQDNSFQDQEKIDKLLKNSIEELSSMIEKF